MIKTHPRIAILILGHNDKTHLDDALVSVLDQTYDNYEIIYIDNGSTDGSVDFMITNYPDIRLIDNKINIGYAPAYNNTLQNIFSNGFEVAVLLNSDVIVDKNWLAELVKSAYQDQAIATVQSKILLWNNGKSNIINTDGGKINYLGFGFCGNYKKNASGRNTQDIDIAFASGCSMLIKKDTYSKIGGLDDEFFAYVEDQDFGWRARMSGYRNILSARSTVWHKYEFKKTKNRNKFYLLERNRLYFIFKNYSLKTIILIMPALLLMELGIICYSLLNGFFIDKLRSYLDFLLNMKKLSADRRIVQGKRMVSDRQLFSHLSPTLDFEDISSLPLKIANMFLIGYYKIIINLI